MKKRIFFSLFIILTMKGFAQNNYYDSLKQVVSKARNDTFKVQELIELGGSLTYMYPDSGLGYAQEALNLSIRLNYPLGKATSLFIIGENFSQIGNYSESLSYGFKALNLFKKIGSRGGIIFATEAIGTHYRDHGDYKEALKFLLNAKQLTEELSDNDSINIIALKETKQQALTFQNAEIGFSYITSQPDSSLIFARRSHQMYSKWLYPIIVMGDAFQAKNLLDSALRYYRMGLELKGSTNNDIVDTYIGMATIFKKQKRYDSSIYYGLKGLDLSRKIKYQKGIFNISGILANNYENIDPLEAIKYYKLNKEIGDSIFSKEKEQQVQSYAFNEQLYQQELQQKLKENNLIYHNRLNTYFLFGGLIILGIISVGLWRKNIYKKKSYSILQKQKEEISAQKERAIVETSLERVRTAAMAMQNSNDVANATALTFKELDNLGVLSLRCGIIIIHDTKVMDVWTSGSDKEGHLIQTSGKLDMTLHPLLENVFASWKRKKSFYTETLIGEEVTNYYKAISRSTEYSVKQLDIKTEKLVSNIFFFEEGGVYIFSADTLDPKSIEILEKFAGVFGLTYRRYLDLKLAEEQTRIALKQAAVDRVRAEIASMRSVEDLKRITPLIWKELKNLKVPFFRCGVFIFNEGKGSVQVYLSTPNGEPLAALDLPVDERETTHKAFEHWKKYAIYLDHWNKEQFVEWMRSLIDSGQLSNIMGYQGDSEPPESLYLHFIPFTQGMLYVGNSEQLTAEQIELVQSLAEAFAIAYARYEDFNQLEQSKAKVEETLTELKETQKQLIQSEKMASLGELTAGIAHEIQNPLNFVNNFSEVNNELLDELKEEATKGNLQEVKTIVDDLKGNNQKIVLHGRRADAIVKGMLQHSRKNSGKKEPTDINALADEYLRLSYHGLRAKDKSFNAIIETHFDQSISKVEVVPQDMGRVLLNLYNNAFYAVNEKKKSTGNGYDPTVQVTTVKTKKGVEIKVKDNGTGIPEKVLDKIYQPFFTTKPTGEGTGLGLSLSYDIITKGHDGEMKVETKEGEGSEFVIELPG